MEILNQIGGLLVGSVPTAITLVLLFLAYTLLVLKPLERTLAERRNRTTGAVEQARGAIAAAEAEAAVLEDKLRAARMDVNNWREAQAKIRQHERETALAETRGAASSRVATAKSEVEAASAEARREIEGNAHRLGQEILRAVLPAGTALPEVQR